MGGGGIRGLKARVGRECCISIGGQVGEVLQLRYTSWRGPRKKSQFW